MLWDQFQATEQPGAVSVVQCWTLVVGSKHGIILFAINHSHSWLGRWRLQSLSPGPCLDNLVWVLLWLWVQAQVVAGVRPGYKCFPQIDVSFKDLVGWVKGSGSSVCWAQGWQVVGCWFKPRLCLIAGVRPALSLRVKYLQTMASVQWW